MRTLLQVNRKLIFHRQFEELFGSPKDILHNGIGNTVIFDVKESDIDAGIVDFLGERFSLIKVFAVGIAEIDDRNFMELASSGIKLVSC